MTSSLLNQTTKLTTGLRAQLHPLRMPTMYNYSHAWAVVHSTSWGFMARQWYALHCCMGSGLGLRPQERFRLGDVGVQVKCAELMGTSNTDEFDSGTAMYRLFTDDDALEQEEILAGGMGRTV